MVDKIIISEEDALGMLNKRESHFLDYKGKTSRGKTVQKVIVAFANTDGGETMIGIDDQVQPLTLNLSRWQGFRDMEEANPIIQTIQQDINPTPTVTYTFYEIKDNVEIGLVLVINVQKSESVHFTSDNNCYIRKGAQSLPIVADKITNLQLSKGQHSYEDQLIQRYNADELFRENELISFLRDYSPKTEPVEFLRKQRLIHTENNRWFPRVSGILLYGENPSAIIPKKCAIKITRYDTSDKEPKRENLKEQYTIEGPVRYQIDKTIEKLRETIEAISTLRESGLEKLKYPAEAIKEIVVNAVIHRDYNISDDISILIFNNRIEIKNPGRLPGYITIENMLDERFARNPTIVRLLNKYPNPPNKDIGEGLNTAFQKMKEMRLKDPIISQGYNSVIVILPHETLASPEDTILSYLLINKEITNTIARELCAIPSENSIKKIFSRLRTTGYLETVAGKKGKKAAWKLKDSVDKDNLRSKLKNQA